MHDLDRAVRVALVDLGRDRPDLGARELGRERLDLALLVAQVSRGRRRMGHAGKRNGAGSGGTPRLDFPSFPEGWQSG